MPAAWLAKAPPEPPRFKVRDEQGQPVVARLHGQHEGTTALILPDGQLGFPNMLVPTDRARFSRSRPTSCWRGCRRARWGISRSTRQIALLDLLPVEPCFAEASGRWLEDLYKRLLDAFQHEMAVHDTELSQHPDEALLPPSSPGRGRSLALIAYTSTQPTIADQTLGDGPGVQEVVDQTFDEDPGVQRAKGGELEHWKKSGNPDHIRSAQRTLDMAIAHARSITASSPGGSNKTRPFGRRPSGH